MLQTILLNARGAPESFADLVQDVGSSVVNITTTTKLSSGSSKGVVPEGSPFEELFRDFQNPNNPRQRQMQMLWVLGLSLAAMDIL